jgi:voltage-gated potassium channel Kch
LLRWLGTSLIIITIFGAIYSKYYFDISSVQINHFFHIVRPSITITGVNNWFSPYYYSVVTFATLGYGDITPSDLAGQIFSVIEVIIGYQMLGGLLSVFAKKIVR